VCQKIKIIVIICPFYLWKKWAFFRHRINASPCFGYKRNYNQVWCRYGRPIYDAFAANNVAWPFDLDLWPLKLYVLSGVACCPITFSIHFEWPFSCYDRARAGLRWVLLISGVGLMLQHQIDAAALGPLLKIGPAENWLKFLWKLNSFFSHDVFTWKWFLAW